MIWDHSCHITQSCSTGSYIHAEHPETPWCTFTHSRTKILGGIAECLKMVNHDNGYIHGNAGYQEILYLHKVEQELCTFCALYTHTCMWYYVAC